MARFTFPQFGRPDYDPRQMQAFVDDVERALLQLSSDIRSVQQSAAPPVEDHSALTGRDAADSHPQSAITGLVESLAAKADQSDIDALDVRVTALEEDEGVTSFIVEIDDTGQTDPQVLYIGKAVVGSSTNQPVWQIQRVTIEADDDAQIRFAGGTTEFNQVWSNRTALVYS